MQNFTIDAAISAWLTQPLSKNTQPLSKKAYIAYEATLRSLREALQREGLDLLSPPEDVARVVTNWINVYTPKRKHVGDVSPATYRHRRDIIHRFYQFINECYKPVPPIPNPIDLVMVKSLKGPRTYQRHTQPEFAFSMESDWGRCYQHFLQSLETANTKYRYRLFLEAYFSSPAKMPDCYTKGDVESNIHRARTSRRNGGKPLVPSPGSVNCRLSAITSFYAYAATYSVEGPDGMPQPLLQRPSPTIGIKHARTGRSHRTLSDEEITRLFSVIPHDTMYGVRDRCLFYAFLMLARRSRELLNLRYGDIESAIFIENGQARPGYRYSYLGKGKNAKEYAEMPSVVKEQIDHYIDFSGRKGTIKADDYIFVGHGNRNSRPAINMPMRGGSLLRCIKQYATRAGLPAEKVCVHLLRHISAQQHFMLNPNLIDTQHLLGHASVATTQLYIEALFGQSDPVAQKLANKYAQLGVK